MLPRFKNVLVPVDFAEKNWSALDVAFEVAVNNKASVTLLHVIEKIDEGDLDTDPDVTDFYSRLKQRAKRELETMGQRFVETGIEVHERIRFGKRATEIVGYANEHGADLIVMSSHRLADANPAASIVTLSYQVSLLCSCPILLVK